ncbi:MAG: transporter [bacterium]
MSAQILETETARPIGRGSLEVSGNLEYQASGEGSEAAVPFALEYGVSDRVELLVEPVSRTWIRPKQGPKATGAGDLETTLTYLLSEETRSRPAISLAGEVKFPTARNSLIGTGYTDFAGYFIMSRLFGRFDTHANLGYTVVGKPSGSSLKNIFNFALGGEYHWNDRTSAYGELLANTAASSAPESGAPESASPEAPTGEVVGTLGLASYVTPRLRLSGGLSLDNNGAVLLRTGFTVRGF